MVPFAPILLLALTAGPDDREGREFYQEKIRPVLVKECYACHSAGAKELKAGLRLDTRRGLLDGGDSGPAIVPGKPEFSLLIRVLEHTSEVAMMPPDRRLPDPVLADFRAWIKQGAPGLPEGEETP